jgi:RNA ligase (TIGR02306 family)
MSEHIIEVIKISELQPHPGADRLDIIKVHGWTCCVKKGDFKVGDLAAYIPPDYVVDTTRPEFAWLRKEGFTKHRVRVQKLRGIVSQGFLIKAPADSIVGENCIDKLSIERYEPHIPGLATGGEAVAGPSFYCEKYDVENFYARDKLLTEGEEVIVTEKLHGCNARFVYHNDRFWCGSRTEWKKEDPKNLWWRCLNQNIWLHEMCTRFPDFVFYGEILGVQGGFPYGKKNDEVNIRIFDVMKDGNWMDWKWLISLLGEHVVPVLYHGPFSREAAVALSEGQTTIANATHIREGIVIQPYPDRIHPKYGRLKLKVVSNVYLEKS